MLVSKFKKYIRKNLFLYIFKQKIILKIITYRNIKYLVKFDC